MTSVHSFGDSEKSPSVVTSRKVEWLLDSYQSLLHNPFLGYSSNLS